MWPEENLFQWFVKIKNVTCCTNILGLINVNNLRYFYLVVIFTASAFSPTRACRAQPRSRRHERLTSQHGGLWYHLWVGRRRGWARSERWAFVQILSGARGDARGRPHHSVSGVAVVVAVCPVVALLSAMYPFLACLADANLLAEAKHNNSWTYVWLKG